MPADKYMGYYWQFPAAIPLSRVCCVRVTHPCATISASEETKTVRLACIRPAASVHPEPGSNSPSCILYPTNTPKGTSQILFIYPTLTWPKPYSILLEIKFKKYEKAFRLPLRQWTLYYFILTSVKTVILFLPALAGRKDTCTISPLPNFSPLFFSKNQIPKIAACTSCFLPGPLAKSGRKDTSTFDSSNTPFKIFSTFFNYSQDDRLPQSRNPGLPQNNILNDSFLGYKS